MRSSLQYFWGKPKVPSELAKARAIDLSIQFSIFWTPFFVLLAWWIDKPLHMLFGMCFDPQQSYLLILRPSRSIRSSGPRRQRVSRQLHHLRCQDQLGTSNFHRQSFPPSNWPLPHRLKA